MTPGFIAKGTGPFVIGHDRAEVERESGGRAAPVHNVTQADIDRLTQYGEGVIIIADVRPTNHDKYPQYGSDR
jgi:hypothetical protein